MHPDLVRRLTAEAIGTFGFFFIGFTGIAATIDGGGALVPVGFGFGLTAMIFAFGHVSGGHFNPAVTAGLAAAKRFPTAEVIPYWVAQLVGGLVAALLIRVMFDGAMADAIVNAPAEGISDGKAFVIEAVFTFLFLLTLATVATDATAPWNGVFAPIAIGLFIFTAAATAGGLTSGSFNPARSIAPAIVGAEFGSLWLFIVGPLVGGIAGGLVHAFVRDAKATTA